MARLAFEHVEKVYPGGTRAVVDLNLEVADGELIVLVGPSGCGKSTLLRLVAGLEPITGGRLRIGDRVANDLSPRERNVAMVFQDYALYPHKTVRGNLEFPLRMRGLARDEIERRVAWAAGILDIAGVLERVPRQLSGGQQQRVAMGRALVREPAAFLLDEPLSNLDAKLRVEVRAEIADLQRRTGATMLYVTHDQTEAMTLGHRVAVLRAGQVLQVAPPRELYERPADAFVAGFIGNPPMNLVPARVVADAAGGVELRLEGGSLTVDAGTPQARALRAVTDAMVLGVRPEAFADGPGAAGSTVVDVVVDHVEWLGHETLAHVHLGAAAAGVPPRLIARLPGLRELERGQPLALHVDPAALHLFAADGRALPVGP
ncbi:MAG: sn-glycerol-3-phosphate ABC transporter ATP-binding protein UgpC [Deltaproteobacteria bacterium]|nr:sn-glycerol-3-phosphate ABC transporter ATP-binding protein UgpC [Deltaproteobacteria bacterium]